MRALENLGVCQVVKKGLIVPEVVLRQPNMVGPTLRTQTNIRLLLSQLQTMGFPPLWSVRSDDTRLAGPGCDEERCGMRKSAKRLFAHIPLQIFRPDQWLNSTNREEAASRSSVTPPSTHS